MDVVALAQHGIDHTVATLGTATTAQHLHRLFRVASHVVFCFDGDRAGRDAAIKAMNTCLAEMHGGRQVSFLFLPEGEDPDDFVRRRGAGAFRDAILAAQPLDEFLFEHLRARTNLRRQDGRARMVELARPLIGAIPPGPYKEMLTRRLGEISGLDDTRYLSGVVGGRRPATRNPGRRTEEPLSTYAYLLSLLLQHPRLVRQLPTLEGLDEQEQPAARVLARVIDIIREDDVISTAALVERFRDTPHHERLEKLAARNHQIAEDLLEEILLQTSHSVRRLLVDEAIDRLLEKADRQPLSDTEKSDLNRFTRLKQDLHMDSISTAGSA
ncbi:MAG: toprim domain-containing protein [Proteobacteria bacterium]|nr:MAG: toprim domain-containing protein [Pseudomonadota bacterium]